MNKFIKVFYLNKNRSLITVFLSYHIKILFQDAVLYSIQYIERSGSLVINIFFDNWLNILYYNLTTTIK